MPKWRTSKSLFKPMSILKNLQTLFLAEEFFVAPLIELATAYAMLRSSRPEVFCKKGVLRNFTKFSGKHLCQRLFFFFNKVAGQRPATLLKKSLWHSCFSVNFVKFLRTPFLIEYLRWLLPNVALKAWMQRV